jgi:hypothetical protein
MRRSATVPIVVVILFLFIAFAMYSCQADDGYNDPNRSGSHSHTTASLQVSAPGEAIVALEALPVKGRAPKTGYSREQFGPAWKDVDKNSCDTRNDILHRDLEFQAIDEDGCTVISGTLHDPYTGNTVVFSRGRTTSSAVQIDHVVALSDAWQKGAQSPDVDRVGLANDPLNLLAVDGPTNQQKSDGDAATWLPPNRGFRCEYVGRQISVKTKYHLWVTEAEKAAMQNVLSTCPGQSTYS